MCLPEPLQKSSLGGLITLDKLGHSGFMMQHAELRVGQGSLRLLLLILRGSTKDYSHQRSVNAQDAVLGR